jgi:upstream activation factor subunit UAF30
MPAPNVSYRLPLTDPKRTPTPARKTRIAENWRMADRDDEVKFFTGGLLVITGVVFVLYVFSLQEFHGRIPIWALPFIAFTSEVPWHGPASIGAVATALIGYRMARRADAGLPFWGDGTSDRKTQASKPIGTAPASRNALDDYRLDNASILAMKRKLLGEFPEQSQMEDPTRHYPPSVEERQSERTMTPSPALARIIGDDPMTRTEVIQKLWAYIKRNGLQDAKNKRMIKADEKLLAVVNGRRQVSLFDMTKLISRHLS